MKEEKKETGPAIAIRTEKEKYERWLRSRRKKQKKKKKQRLSHWGNWHIILHIEKEDVLDTNKSHEVPVMQLPMEVSITRITNENSI